MNRPHPIRGFRAALTFLTRLPVGGHPFTPAELAWAPAFFPLVGLSLGLVLAAVHLGGSTTFGPWASACLTVSVSLMLTGAFHEDGLADSADALGGGYTREQVLSILKDSRIGTFGSAALTLSLVARVALMVEAGADAPLALIVIECASRCPPVVVLAAVPYASRPALSKSKDVAGSGWPQAGVAVGLTLAVLAMSVGPIEGFRIALVSALVAGQSARYLASRVGGMTGDFLGAIQQLVAIALWLTWA